MNELNFNKYKLFSKYTSNKSINIPNSNTKWVPQGICIVENNILITAYDSEKKENSELYIINKKGELLKTLIFDNKYHVGGIAYDKRNKLIFVAAYNKVNIYDKDKLLSTENRKILKDYKSVNIQDNYISRVSYLTCYESKLYIGMFSKNKKTKLKKYIINFNNNMELKDFYDINLNKIQGLCIYKDFYIFSCSYGRYNSSYLHICKLENNVLTSVFKIEMPCLSEQIVLDNDKLLILFESCSTKFTSSLRILSPKYISNIIELNIKEILENVE